MAEKIPPTGFIVGIAFLFGSAFAALVIMGLGLVTWLIDVDNPFAPLNQGAGAIASAFAGLVWILVTISIGMRRDNRVRLIPILITAGWTYLAYLVAFPVAELALSHGNPWAELFKSVVVVASPAAAVIVLSAAATSWAYIGTLQWQARNSETKQFLQYED
jgi:hypothetical protein